MTHYDLLGIRGRMRKITVIQIISFFLLDLILLYTITTHVFPLTRRAPHWQVTLQIPRLLPQTRETFAMLCELWPLRPLLSCLYHSKRCCAGGKRRRARRRNRGSAHVLGAQRCVMCRCTSTPVVKMRVTVDGKSCQMVVDTGDEGTILRYRVLTAKDIPEASQPLCGVTGHCAAKEPGGGATRLRGQ